MACCNSVNHPWQQTNQCESEPVSVGQDDDLDMRDDVDDDVDATDTRTPTPAPTPSPRKGRARYSGRSPLARPAPPPPPSPRLPPPPRLRIKLKLPARPKARRVPAKRKRTSEDEVESEDDDEDEDEDAGPDYLEPEDADADPDETSREPSAVPARGARLTARQAALAGDTANLISLQSSRKGGPVKKPVLTETELALRREETARKRKNVTEKRLEDEKTETINRLLKKSSRGRGKKEVPVSGAPSDDEAGVTPSEIAEEREDATPPRAVVPTFRWVSSARGITFSVPDALLPRASAAVA